MNVCIFIYIVIFKQYTVYDNYIILIFQYVHTIPSPNLMLVAGYNSLPEVHVFSILYPSMFYFHIKHTLHDH